MIWVAICKDFKHVDKFIEEQIPQLILLDINIPYYDGFLLVQWNQKNHKIPILIHVCKDRGYRPG